MILRRLQAIDWKLCELTSLATMTADTALRLGRYFGTSAAFWMGIQAQYDLERTSDELGAALSKIAIDSAGLNSDIHASAEYRAHAIGVLTKRAVAAAIAA